MRHPNEIIINNKTLEQILIDHKHWLDRDCIGWENMRANLSYTDLSYTDLSHANLCEANLSYTNLSYTDLSYTYLCEANLSYTNLSYTNLNYTGLYRADLQSADLSCATLLCTNLYGTNLYGANLWKANLYNAGLSEADLTCANLYGANLLNTRGKLIEYRKGKILTEDIIGYKKCKNDVIVTLKIPKGAIIFSINGYKCRTNKAKVINIDGANRAYSHYNNMSYYVGDEFNIYNFDCEYNAECAKGIHFFMSKEEAKQYY